MGAIGGILRATSGNGVSVVKKVKSQPLQGALDNSLTDYNALRTSGNQALGDYISQYMARAGDAKTFGGQEEGAVSDFFNGNLSTRLSQLRASRASAVNAAADVGVNQAIRASNGNALANEGGGSSYQTRQMIGAVAPIRTAAAVDNANQERADFGFVKEGQMNNIGRRNDIINRTASFGLAPESARRSMFAQNEGFVGNMLQADQLNHFYGLKQDTNKWADIADSLDQGILNAASIAGSVSGGGMKDGGLVRRGYASGGAVEGDGPYPGESEEEYRLRKYGINHEYSGTQLDTDTIMAKRGGKIKGPGTGTSDSIPIKVSDGEFVMPAVAVKMPGVLPLLEAIRQMALSDSTARKGGKDGKHFAEGGAIGGGGFGGGAFEGGMGGDWGYNPGQANAALGGGAQPQKQAAPKSSGGGGGGGLSGQASQLQARVDRNLMAQWFPSSSTFGSEAAPEFDVPGANSPWFMNNNQEGVLA